MELMRLARRGGHTSHAKYVFRCPVCGSEVERSKRDGLASSMCKACYAKTLCGESSPSYRHGGRTSFKAIWNIWAGMKQRCKNPNNPKFKRYGARGITVFEPWLDFATFKEWALSNGWRPGLSLDRISLDGNYEPQNCQFITISENSRWKSTTKNLHEKPGLRPVLLVPFAGLLCHMLQAAGMVA